MQIPFVKMHGLGNDFVIINNFDKSLSLSKKQITLICDRHIGVGADGLILIESSKCADCFMNYYNSDGSIAEMCGNGIRCTAKLFLESRKDINSLRIETRGGIRSIDYNSDDTFSVSMGNPMFDHLDFPSGKNVLYGHEFQCVSIGNPHAVTFVNTLSMDEVRTIGPKVERDDSFPNNINVEFAQKISDVYFKILVWERGSEITSACGTGACAVYAVARKNHMTSPAITVELPGGTLSISENINSEIIMKGTAEKVFNGFIEI